MAIKLVKSGFTCGTFDLLHAGHIKMLVGLQSDPTIDRKEKNKPVQTLEERLIQLKAVRYVDEVLIYDTEQDLYDMLTLFMPDVRILGADHEGKEFTGHDLDIELYFNSRDHNWSSSELRKRIAESENSNG